MSGAEIIRSMVESMMKCLVDDPSQVSVRIREGDQTTVIEIRTAQKDTGKVIGKQGIMAKAIRTFVNSIGVKYGVRCIVDIVDFKAASGF